MMLRKNLTFDETRIFAQQNNLRKIEVPTVDGKIAHLSIAPYELNDFGLQFLDQLVSPENKKDRLIVIGIGDLYDKTDIKSPFGGKFLWVLKNNNTQAEVKGMFA